MINVPFAPAPSSKALTFFTGDGTPAWMIYQESGATPSNMATAHCAMGVGALRARMLLLEMPKRLTFNHASMSLGVPGPGLDFQNSYGLNHGLTAMAVANTRTRYVSLKNPFTGIRKAVLSGTRR